MVPTMRTSPRATSASASVFVMPKFSTPVHTALRIRTRFSVVSTSYLLSQPDRSSAFIASVIATVSTLTRTTLASSSIMLSL